MLAVAVFGGISAILGFAARGNIVAHATGIVLIGLVVPFTVMAALYWSALGLIKALPGQSLPVGASLPKKAENPNTTPESKPELQPKESER